MSASDPAAAAAAEADENDDGNDDCWIPTPERAGDDIADNVDAHTPHRPSASEEVDRGGGDDAASVFDCGSVRRRLDRPPTQMRQKLQQMQIQTQTP